MSKNHYLRKISYWLLFMLCFVALPGLLIAFAFQYTGSQSQQNQLRKHGEAIRGFYQNLQQFANNEAFYCHYLNLEFSNASIGKKNTRNELEQKLAEIKKKLGFDYVIYSNTTGIATSSFVLESTRDWELAMQLLAIFYRDGHAKVSEELFLASGRLLGPQLNLLNLEGSKEADDPHLIYPDSTFAKPMLWTGLVHNYQVLVLIKPASLETSDGVWTRVDEFSRASKETYRFSFAEKGSFRHPEIAAELRDQIEEAYQKHENEKQAQIHTRDFIVFPKFLNPKLTILGYIDRSSLKTDQMLMPAFLAALVFLIFTVIAGRYSYGLIINDRPDDLSLRWKLRFLFFFANGLPLIVLFFIGSDYLDQKRGNLLREMHGKGIQFVQDFDEKIELEYAKALASKKVAEKGLIASLSTQQLNDEILKNFVGGLSKNVKWKVVLVASQSHLIGTEDGIIDDKKGIYPQGYNKASDQYLKQREYTRKVGQFFLDKINGTKISDKAATEIEMLLESVTQKPMVNFIFDMLRNRGTFIDWGFGRNIHPSILDTMTLENSKFADYFFIATLRREVFQSDFLKQCIPQANRNIQGLKILAIHDSRFSVPIEAYADQNVRNFASLLTTYPGDEIKFLTYEKQEYLAVGFEGKYIREFKLIGLYPLEKIDTVIDNQRRQLIIFAILSMLMTLALSQVLSQSFLVPLRLLTTGAQAIENKNFKHRLPDLGRDEFGAMGGIFNDVMVELEELSVAGAIQEQLLPQQP
ncbi:MAG: hypothetical protein ACD_39C00454G0002, partial [uncultured bacterium]